MSNAALEWAFAAQVSLGEKVVLLALANAHDAESGECRPSQTQLARDCCMSDRRIRDNIERLEQRGLVAVSRAGGRVSSYVLRLGVGATPDAASGVKQAPTPDATSGVPRTLRLGYPDDTSGVSLARAYRSTNLLSSLKEVRKKERKIYPSNDENSAAFEAFWSAYPRKVGKGNARRAFAAALKKNPAPEILAGLLRARFSDDVNYIPHASTWLNGERWADDPNATTPPQQFRNGFLELVRREGMGSRAVEPENQFLRLVQNGK